MAAPQTLLVGSMSVAEAYQTQLQALSTRGVEVRSEMADRIIDQAAILPHDAFAHILVVLAADERLGLLQALLPSLLRAMDVNGEMEICETAPVDASLRELLSASFGQVRSTASSLIASSPMRLNGVSASQAAPAVALRLKSRGQNTTKKASLWALTQPADVASTPTIDESALLTPADLKRRETVQRPDCDVKRTRKACKNCSCGLRELLLQEADDIGSGTGASAPEGVQTVSTGAVTSSCGSCYLGDAFRCASCPWRGLPAFEPGEKVALNGFGDDL